MKYLIFLISFLSFTHLQSQSIELKWKIPQGDTLIYSTVMEQIDTSIFSTAFGGESEDDDALKIQQMMKELNKSISGTKFAVRLFKSSQEHIEIEMFTSSQELPIALPDSLGEAKEMLKEFQKMMKGIMLRGSINEDGTIHSFWVKREQKNLIAMLFELPGRPIEIGDSWSLSTNLIGNDQNFVCDSSFYKNEVKFIDLKTIDGDTLAVFKYDLLEYVDGIFNMPNMFGKGGAKPTMMTFGFKGIAEFSLNKGKWHSFEAVMAGEASGVMNFKQRVKYSLIEQ